MNQLQTSNTGLSFDAFQQQGVAANQVASREAEEVKMAIFLAKQFPRNIIEAENKIKESCKRLSLASTAIYSYKRGSSKVEGPSIRLAEVLAQNWGNMQYGIKELENKNGESTMMAYCWDMENNVKQEKIFTVKHVRDTSKYGKQKLEQERDIYEATASSASRRLRACILGVIPGDVVEMAVEQCNQTMRGQSDVPLKDRIKGAVEHFGKQYGVTQEMIEKRFGYNAEAFTEYTLVELTKINTSLKDGMSVVDDWFEKPKVQNNVLMEGFKNDTN